MDVNNSEVENVTEGGNEENTQVNGVQEAEASAAVTILTTKPLVYDYEDTAAEDWPQDGGKALESAENKSDATVMETPEATVTHSDMDNTSLANDTNNGSTEVNEDKEIVAVINSEVDTTQVVADSTTTTTTAAAPEVIETAVISDESEETPKSESIQNEPQVEDVTEQFETVVILRDGSNKNEECSENLHRSVVDDWDVDDGSEGLDEEKNQQEKQTRPSQTSDGSEKSSNANGVSQPRGTPKQRLFLANRYLSRKEAVKEILKSKPTPVVSILPKKDLILAIELAKHSTTGASVEVENEPEDILQILESDQVGDWREALPPASIKHGNDTEIMQEVSALTAPDPHINRRGRRPGQPSQAKAAVERRRQARLVEKKLALEQLAKEFKTKRRKRSEGRTLAVAAEDLERALSATPVLAGKRKRRPCYQPEERDDDDEPELVGTKPSAIIKTYAPKPRASDPLNEVGTALETIAIVNRHLSVERHIDELVKPTEDSKVNEEEKTADKIKKKRVRELQQLLGDEGAVRMIYDTAQKEEGQSTPMFKKTKKGLLQKTKFVEDAVLRASGASEKSLRGKRLNVSGEEKSPEDTLFPPATPGSVQNSARSRKKPKPAEASRILYRHSSSESFDGSEGLRRSTSEISGLDMSPERTPIKTYSTPQRKSTRPRKVSSKLTPYVAEPILQKKKEKKADELQDVDELPTTTDSKLPQPDVKTSQKVSKSGRSVGDIVRVSQRGGLVEIALAPTQSTIKNGLRTQTILAIKAALEVAKNDPLCRAVLFKTEGKIFCQGVDLGYLTPGSDVLPLIDAIKEFTKILVNMEKPLIAGVQGTAVGLGVAMLPLFDVVIASDASTFWTPYARLGQGLEAGASFTFPHISRAMVSELIYKGSVLSADEALHLGLITEAVPDKEFSEQLIRIAADISTQSDRGLRMAKELMSNAAKTSIIDALERECASLLKSWTNPECLATISECLTSGEFIL